MSSAFQQKFLFKLNQANKQLGREVKIFNRYEKKKYLKYVAFNRLLKI